METKTCSLCKTEKNIDAFPKSNQRKDGRSSWCKSCVNSSRKEKGFNLYSYRSGYTINYQRQLRKTEKHKSYEKKYRRKYGETFNGVVARLLGGVHTRAKLYGHEVGIDREWIVEHLLPMKCEATGIELTLKKDKNVEHTPFKPSIDRIDNNKGYTKANCRIVCVIYNKSKSDGSDQDVVKMATALVEFLGAIK